MAEVICSKDVEKILQIKNHGFLNSFFGYAKNFKLEAVFMDLAWFDTQFDEMVFLLESWANVNSYSYHEKGLSLMFEKAEKAFSRLEPDEIKKVSLTNGPGLFLKKRAHAPIQIFLGGHIDTVYPEDSAFQKVTYRDDRKLVGPGVTDMKGGLVVLLKSLEAFEQTPLASRIGWEIFLNPDEEIGSIYSVPFILECAKRCDLALIFEPSWPDGAIVSQRKGSANYYASAKGVAAHAGRDSQKGENAISKLMHFLIDVEKLKNKATVNIGMVKGGSAFNIVPDYAESWINIRSMDIGKIEQKILQLSQKHSVKVESKSSRPSKPFDRETEKLFEQLKLLALEIPLSLSWRESGGVTDGNFFAHSGVPTIDSLGVSGEKIHTENETIQLKSLVERSKLTFLILNAVAKGEIMLNRKKKR